MADLSIPINAKKPIRYRFFDQNSHYQQTDNDYRSLVIRSDLKLLLRLQEYGSPTRPVNLRRFATPTNLKSYPEVGAILHGFKLKRTKHIPELQLTAYHLHHEKTGAEFLHVARDDRNNVFSIGFKTNPPDATGVPHILEHTTLCGSEKY